MVWCNRMLLEVMRLFERVSESRCYTTRMLSCELQDYLRLNMRGCGLTWRMVQIMANLELLGINIPEEYRR